MQPVLEKGSLLFVKEKTKYGKGDIVTFPAAYNGEIVCVTHRIVDQVREKVYITKGDANKAEDRGCVKEKQIKGIVTGYIPCYGYICAYIKTRGPVVFAALFLSVLSYFGFFWD